MAIVRGPGARKAHERNKLVRVTAQARKGKDTSQMDGCRAVSPDKPLTDKQKAFVKAIASGESVPNAQQRAGMSLSNPAYGYRLMAMPNIQRALAVEREAYARAAELTKRDVMEMLKESYDMAKLMSEPSSMVSAAREIGKMCGFYEPKKVDITFSAAGRAKVEQLTDEELFRLIEDASAEVALLPNEHASQASQATSQP